MFSPSCTIPLSQGKFAIVDEDDFEFLNQWKWYAVFSPKWNLWYAARGQIRPKRILIRMHRAIMDAPPGLHIDHRDGNGLNNQRSNLRLATNQQNQCNRGAQRNNTSGCKGVYWNKRDKKWQAFIKRHGKDRYLGQFDNKQDAANAYAMEAKRLDGEFAHV